MLEMRLNCETCNNTLPTDSDQAYICPMNVPFAMIVSPMRTKIDAPIVVENFKNVQNE